MIRRIILLTILFCGFATLVEAQTKAETKLYNTTKSKEDIKSINKFLAKFPNSVYANEITKLKDSITFFKLNKNDVTAYMNFVQECPNSYYLSAAYKEIERLNTSSISDAQSKEIAAAYFGGSAPDKYIAKSVKYLNNENIVLVWENKGNGSYNIEVLTQNGNNWNKSNSLTENKYILDDNLKEFEFVESCKVVNISGEQYLQFSYTNRSNKVDNRSKIANNNVEYIVNIYSIKDNSVFCAMYSGLCDLEQAAQPFNQQGFAIYGKCNDTAGGGMYATDQMKHLIKEISNNSKLQPLDKERFLTQETIQWWYNNNPEGAKQLKFGAMEKENPIAIAFEQSTQKEKVGDKIVNFFDIFGTTVIVAYDRVDKTYALVWCEPVAVKKSDAELSNLYQEKQSVIALVYYKGNTVYKKRINLNSRAIY